MLNLSTSLIFVLSAINNITARLDESMRKRAMPSAVKNEREGVLTTMHWLLRGVTMEDICNNHYPSGLAVHPDAAMVMCDAMVMVNEAIDDIQGLRGNASRKLIDRIDQLISDLKHSARAAVESAHELDNESGSVDEFYVALSTVANTYPVETLKAVALESWDTLDLFLANIALFNQCSIEDRIQLNTLAGIYGKGKVSTVSKPDATDAEVNELCLTLFHGVSEDNYLDDEDEPLTDEDKQELIQEAWQLLLKYRWTDEQLDEIQDECEREGLGINVGFDEQGVYLVNQFGESLIDSTAS